MNTKWAWDWKHIVLIVAFVAGVVWAGGNYFAGRTIDAQALIGFIPVAILIVNNVFSFFKNPPNNPKDAFDEGDGGGGAPARVDREVPTPVLGKKPPMNSRDAYRTLGTVASSMPIASRLNRVYEAFCAAVLALMLLVVVLPGCALFGPVEPPVKDCVGRVLDDAAKGMTVAQIIADAGGPCALDAGAVIAILLQSNNPSVRASKAYAEAMRAHSATVAP